MTLERNGGCLCGQVRYRVTAEPLRVRVCWCRDCQRMAANGTVNALFPADAVEITGSLGEYVQPAESGNPVRRRFCPTCGCHLFADTPGYSGVMVVRIGTLDDPSSVRPASNIWSSSAPRWACLDPLLERVERQPRPATPAPENVAGNGPASPTGARATASAQPPLTPSPPPRRSRRARPATSG